MLSIEHKCVIIGYGVIIDMKASIFPVIVSTREALNIALDSGCSVIYIDEKLLSSIPDQIDDMMGRSGHTATMKAGKHGMFYLNDRSFDPELHKIHDPMKIL